MAFVGNVVIALILAAVFLGGGSLFFIARQDDSRAGRVIGVLSATASTAVALYLTAGHHWL